MDFDFDKTFDRHIDGIPEKVRKDTLKYIDDNPSVTFEESVAFSNSLHGQLMMYATKDVFKEYHKAIMNYLSESSRTLPPMH